ncbi:hypothetical protein PFICI_08330 [Pestalotiopsis fici W106-1]|uniref:Multiple myeloma tumor-associated protein 2-like N-terminal domain-containing protein n=1 Tax=Pestalotiopsis fici (strain W106-1 / CGMCC3.15140) TaxID=1229662 RepID=W3X6K2_PESFW|nr:uncharacterized protein PFICI_08330 [Pestalotiopsis fici W106-1]ETS80801.1 hypothetical protein PFICI_08330 [Pestalotiopsis fici W106-1]
MDLVSSIRKSGSRGGVNFSWDEVANSAHRENYLGHSLKAPVGRWQQGRDLEWYAKNKDADAGPSDETPEERAARERREEIKRVKEAEEDALARALGLPVKQRDQTGANAIEIGKSRIGPQEAPSSDTKQQEAPERKRHRRHDDSERRHRRREEEKTRVAERGTIVARQVEELPAKTVALIDDNTGGTTMTADGRTTDGGKHTAEIAATRSRIIALEGNALGAQGQRALISRNGADHTRGIDDGAVALTIESVEEVPHHDFVL